MVDKPYGVCFCKDWDILQQWLEYGDRTKGVALGFDLSWFDDIHFREEDGIIFVSGGVFMYFHEEDIKRVFCALAKRFPGGEIYFDAESKMALKGSNNMVKRSGNHGAMMYFYVNDATMFERWSPKIRLVSDEPGFKGIKPRKHWSFRVRMTARLFSKFKNMSFVHLQFIK